MRSHGACIFVLLALWACGQESQELPFSLEESEPVSRSIGTGGGTVSSADGLALEVPEGALQGTVRITVARSADPEGPRFDPVALDGATIPETGFDVDPAGLELEKPGRMSLRIRDSDLAPGELLRLGLASGPPDEPEMIDAVTLDLRAGVIKGPVSRLGGVAVRRPADVLAVETGEAPELGGGTIRPGPAAAPTPSASSSSRVGQFSIRCAATGAVPRCLSAGGLQLWATEELRRRASEDFVVVGPNVDAVLEFSDFVDGVPTRATGRLAILGSLRARVGEAVTTFGIDEVVSTGEGEAAKPSPVHFAGSQLTIETTSEGASRTFAYEIRPVGTGEQLVLTTTEEVELENDDGSITEGIITMHLRLRRN